MTIRTTTSRALYAGNGVTTIFSFPYLFLANGDLEVRRIAVNGASTVLTLTTHYTVTGARNDAGGSVTMIVAPASGEQLLIRRIVDLTQETAYPSGDSFPAKSHERALDKLTMMVQQHDEELARTIQIPPESNVDASTINVKAVEVVAGIAAGVSAVAAIDAKVVIAANNIAAILAAPAQAAAAAASAVAAAASANAAAAAVGATIALTNNGTTNAPHYLTFAVGSPGQETLKTDTAKLAYNPSTGALSAASFVGSGAGLTAESVPRAALPALFVLGTAVTLTTQTAVDFTGIPSWAKRITLMLSNASTNGTSPVQIQIGDSGGIETSGYVGAVGVGQQSQNWLVTALSAGFAIDAAAGASAANVFSGFIELVKVTGNTWAATGQFGQSVGSAVRLHTLGGHKPLSDVLTQIRLTTVGGTDQFDAGTVNISYE